MVVGPRAPRLDPVLSWLVTRRGVVVTLALIWLVHLAANAAHVVGDQSGLCLVDAPHQLSFVLQYPSDLRHQGVTALWYLFRGSIEWPPLAHLALGLPAALIDASLPAVRLYNMFFFGLLLVGVYWCGRQVASSAAGLLAAALCSLLPAIHGMSRQIGLDFPATAMVALSAAALMATDGFSSRRSTVVAGLLTGLAVLTRGQCLFFVVGVGLWQLGRGVRGQRRRHALVHAVLCGVLAAVVAAPWWWGRLGPMVQVFAFHSHAKGILLEGDPTFWGGIRVYLGRFYQLTSAPMLLLMVATGAVGLKRRSPQRWTLVLWVVLPLAIHMLMAVRNPRYVLPLVPVLPIAAAVGALSLQQCWLRRLVVLLLLGVGVVVWTTGIGHGWRTRQTLGAMDMALLGGPDLNRPAGPDSLVAAARRLVAALSPRLCGQDVPVLMSLGGNHHMVNATVVLLRSHFPRLLLHSSVMPPTPRQAALNERATRRFVLSPERLCPAAEGFRLLARVVLTTDPTQGGLDRPTEVLVLHELAAGVKWTPPLERY